MWFPQPRNQQYLTYYTIMESTHPLIAMTFSGPAHSQPVVRLVSEPIIPAETTMLGLFGLHPDAQRVVGKSTQHAVGFPAWPIMNDPDNAHHALNLVAELEQIRRRPSLRRARTRIDAVTAQLAASAPHFVPTFLEEVARIFVGVDNRRAAQQYFGKARTVERAHGVAIDVGRHEAAFVEFAHAGVVSATELATECRAVGNRGGDVRQGFAYALRLVHAQARAGVCPSTDVVAALRQLGGYAGMDHTEVDDVLVNGLLKLPVFKKASTKLFVTLAETLKQHPEALEVLWDVKPRKTTPLHFLRLWHAAGLLEFMHTDRTRYAQWLVDFINSYSGDDGISDYSAVLEGELAYCGDALHGLRVHKVLIWMPLNVIDLLCEHGVVWDGDRTDASGKEADWQFWLEDDYAPHRRSLVHAARNPEIFPHFIEGIYNFEVEKYLDVFLSHEGARDLLGKKIDELAKNHNSISNSNDIINDWSFLASPKIYEAYGERIKKLFEHDATDLLVAAVRTGTIAELTWPAYEQALARVRSKSKETDFSVFNSYPAIAVVSGSYVEIVDGDVTIASGELPARYEDLHSIYTVGDKIYVFITLQNQQEPCLMWLGDAQTYAVDDRGWGATDGYALPLSDGTRLTAFGLLEPNEITSGIYGPGNVFTINRENSPIFSTQSSGDNVRLWTDHSFVDWEGTAEEALEKLDVCSYGIDISAIPENAKICAESLTCIPACPTTKKSLLGVVKDHHVYIVYSCDYKFFIMSPHGTFESGVYIKGAFPRPGGGIWLASYSTNKAWKDAETGAKITLQDKNSILANIPFAAFHQFYYRDKRASVFMRNYSREQAQQVIAATTDDDVRSIFSTQLEVTDNVLLDELVATQKIIRKHVAAFQKLAKGLMDDISPPSISINDAAAELLYIYADKLPSENSYTTSHHAKIVASFIADPKNFSTTYTEDIDAAWIKFMHNERAIIGMLGSPLLPHLYSANNAFVDLVDFFRTATMLGIFGNGWRCALVKIGTFKRIDEAADIFPVGSVIDGCLAIESEYDWGVDECCISRFILMPDDREKVGEYTVTHQKHVPMKAEDIIACLDALAAAPERVLGDNVVNTISCGTALPSASIRYFFGGMKKDENDKFSSRYKFTTAEEKVTQLHYSFLEDRYLDHFSDDQHDSPDISGFLQLLAQAVPPGNPVSYIDHGPDLNAIISYWHERLGEPGIHITADTYYKVLVDSHLLSEPLWYVPRYETLFSRTKLDDSSFASNYCDCLAAYLHLAQNLELNDPGRPFVAHKLTWLRESVEKNLKNSEYLAAVPFGSSFTDPGFTGDKRPDVQAIRLLMDGYLDTYIADLSIVHDVEGCPWDPAVSAPEVVDQVATQLNVSHDAARYYLQLLGLMYPTDADVRRWNGWDAASHRAAVAELANRGLIVEGHRARAGRSWFLPGAWLEGVKKDRPVEEWKARHYLLWQDVKVRPVLPGSPLLMPITQLYQQVWQRYISGDVPGYVELRTKKYRPRKNR